MKRKHIAILIILGIVCLLLPFAIDFIYDVLKKGKYTKPQIECTHKQRIKNLKGAFYVVNSEKIKGKRIVLIDDVYTTGSTLKECAKALLKAGAKSVDTLTIAKVHK